MLLTKRTAMLQKLNKKNPYGQELYQEVHIADKSQNHKKVFGSVGTLKEFNNKQLPSVRKKHH